MHDFQIPFGENLMVVVVVMEVEMNLNDIVAFDPKAVQTLASNLDASSLSYPGILMFKLLKIKKLAQICSNSISDRMSLKIFFLGCPRMYSGFSF